jgi:hypothetical protein
MIYIYKGKERKDYLSARPQRLRTSGKEKTRAEKTYVDIALYLTPSRGEKP